MQRITPRPGSGIWRCTNLDQIPKYEITEYNCSGYSDDPDDDMSFGDPEAMLGVGASISDGITTFEVEDLLSS